LEDLFGGVADAFSLGAVASVFFGILLGYIIGVLD